MFAKKSPVQFGAIVLCLSFLSSCSSDLWKGGTYVGDGTVNGVKPGGSAGETFKLETKDAKSGKRRFVTMDPANYVLGYCGLEVWSRENASEGKFELTYPDTECDTIVNGKKVTVKVTGGDIMISGNEVKLSLIGNDGTTGGSGTVYKFEITANRKS